MILRADIGIEKNFLTIARRSPSGRFMVLVLWIGLPSLAICSGEVPVTCEWHNLLIGPRPAIGLEEAENDLNPDCLRSLNALLAMDLTSSRDGSAFRSLPDLSTCPEEMQEIWPDLPRRCQPFFSKYSKGQPDVPTWDDNLIHCQAALWITRIYVEARVNTPQVPDQISDCRVLMDKLVMSILTLGRNLTPEDVYRLEQIHALGVRLLQLNPKLTYIVQIVLFSDATEMCVLKDKTPDTLDRQAQADLQLYGGAVAPVDPSILNIGVLFRSHGFEPHLLEREAKRLIASKRTSDQGYFLLAWSKWKKGDRQATIDSLQKAVKFGSNPEYAQVLAMARDPQKRPGDDGLFAAKMEFDPEGIEEEVMQTINGAAGSLSRDRTK